MIRLRFYSWLERYAHRRRSELMQRARDDGYSLREIASVATISAAQVCRVTLNRNPSGRE